MVFSLLSFVVAVPSAIKVFNWTATLHKGDITFEAPMLYALGFVGLFMLGGLTGLILAAPALDVPLPSTYFVVAHFHYVMVGGSVMAYLGGIHYWWPKITGRMYSEALAKFCRDADVLRFQSDLLSRSTFSATRACRDATTLICRSSRCSMCCRAAGASMLAHRVPAASRLFVVVAAPRRGGWQQSVERARTRMADQLAAAEAQLH